MAPPVKYNSRYNTTMRLSYTTMMSILVGLGVTVGGFVDPALTFLNNPAINAGASGIIGTLAGLGAVGIFNSRLAKSSSTVGQAYQEALIWPHPHQTSGYLVLQPHHRKTGWRLRDAITWRKPPKILGAAATEDQAQALCRAVTQEDGVVIDPSRLSDAQSQAFDKAYAKYTQDPSVYDHNTQKQLTGLWRVTAVDPTTPEILAYRTRYTAHGRQIEFYPSPPQTTSTVTTLKADLAHRNLFAPADQTIPESLPEGTPLVQAPDLHTAWDVQRLQTQATIPWTLLNVANPNQMPYWTAGCAVPTANGTGLTWHFFPEPPRTMTDPQRLSQDLRRYSVPDQTPAEWPVAVTPPSEALAQWNAQARPTPALSPAAPTLAVSLRHPSL